MNRIFQFEEPPEPPEPPSWESAAGEFEPFEIDESHEVASEETLSSFFFRKNHQNYLHQYPDGVVVRLSREDVISVLKAERAFDAQRNLDQFFYDIRHNHAVDYDGPLPGYPVGLHPSNGQALFCSSAAQPLRGLRPFSASGAATTPAPEAEKPRSGPDESGWPVIAELLRRLLITPESGDIQRLTLLAHLKVAHATLVHCLEEPTGTRRNVRPQQMLAICGPVASGKTFLFEQVIAPILGNRVVDAFKAFCSSAEGFTGELLNGEVWKIDDRHGSTRSEMRRTFASNIKAYLFSGNVSIHPKGKTPMTLAPYGRLFLICNDEDKDMLVLPDMTPDMLDKVIILRSVHAESPMPSKTDKERQLYQAAVEAELPYLVSALEQWEIPTEMQSERTGVKSYHNPIITSTLEASHPEVLLIEMIHQALEDHTLIDGPDTMWQGTATELHRKLTAKASHDYAKSASELLSSPKTTGMYLGRIAADSDHFAASYYLCVRKGPHRKGIKTYLINAIPTPEEANLPF